MFSSFSNSASLNQNYASLAVYRAPVGFVTGDVEIGVQQISNSLINFTTATPNGSATVPNQSGSLAYRSGNYYATASACYPNSPPYNAGQAFNVAVANGNWSSPNVYVNGVYNGVSTTVSGIVYSGHWLQIQFPYSFVFKSTSFGGHYSSLTYFNFQTVIGGSNDGINWYYLGTINTTTSAGNNLSLPSNTASYSYYRYIVTKHLSGHGFTAMSSVVISS